MSLLLLLLLLLFQTFAVSLVKPVKPRSMTVFPDTLNFRFRKSTTDGFTETGADTRFGFDKWITLEVKRGFQPNATHASHASSATWLAKAESDWRKKKGVMRIGRPAGNSGSLGDDERYQK